MEMWFGVLGWLFRIITMVVNGFIIFLVFAPKPKHLSFLKRWLILVLGCSLFLLAFSATLQPNALHALKPLTLICIKIYLGVMFFL